MEIALKELVENEELLLGVINAENPDELAKVFLENGLALEEGLSMDEAFKIVKAQENSELSDAELENVSGGIALSLAVSVVITTAVSAGVAAFIAGYGYQKFKNSKKSK